jgi:hypothetical protein
MSPFHRVITGLLGLFFVFLGMRAVSTGRIRYDLKAIGIIFERSQFPGIFWVLVLLHFAAAIVAIYIAVRRSND